MLQESTGLLSVESEMCFQYNLPLTAEQLSLLVAWCSSCTAESEEVRYKDLVELINWQQDIPADLETRIRERNIAGEKGLAVIIVSEQFALP